MKPLTKILVGFGGLLALGKIIESTATASVDDEANDNTGGGGGSMSNKMRLWKKLELLQLDDRQRYFLMLVAYGESKFSPAAHNNTASEREASARGAQNNPELVQRAIACGIAADKLRTGSWGMFQRLAPFLSGDAFEIFGPGPMACQNADPTNTTDDFQIASALETAGDLQGYNGWKAAPTVGNLRLGWAAPALMGYMTKNAARLKKYRRHAAEAKLPAGIVDAPLNPFPRNVAQMYAHLRANPV